MLQAVVVLSDVDPRLERVKYQQYTAAVYMPGYTDVYTTGVNT